MSARLRPLLSGAETVATPIGGLGTHAASAPSLGLEQRIVLWYKQRCYLLLGRRLDLVPNPDLARKLRQAGYAASPGLYQALMVITLLVAMGVALPVLSAVFRFGVQAPYWYLQAIVLSGMTGLTAAAAFPFALKSRTEGRKGRLERELAFSLSELAVLASIGLSPIELVRRMGHRIHDPTMTGEFRRVAYKADVQGKDLVTALAETAKESASPLVQQTLWDLGNMIHQGGDLDQYLRGQSDEVLSYKRVTQKQFIDKLGTYADIYITLVLIGIMFVGVGVFLLDAFGMTAGGLDGGALLLILTFAVVPIIVLVMGILLNTAHRGNQ